VVEGLAPRERTSENPPSLRHKPSPLSVGRVAGARMAVIRMSGALPEATRNAALERLSASPGDLASAVPATVKPAVGRRGCGEDC
jgi:hypothetical protein